MKYLFPFPEFRSESMILDNGLLDPTAYHPIISSFCLATIRKVGSHDVETLLLASVEMELRSKN